MLKRIMLTLTFTAAFGAAGLCLTDQADARWGRRNRPYAAYHYAPPADYDNLPYRFFYRGHSDPPPYYYYSDPGFYRYPQGSRLGIWVGPGR